MKKLLCYWCSEAASSREHVPPKCLFPEAAFGTNYRNQLITVPSCDLHNIAKSSDDEYLFCVLTFNILNNHIGNKQAQSKVIRALKRSQALTAQVMAGLRQVTVEEIATKKIDSTLALKIDNRRIENALEHISRGVYFHHFGISWNGRVRVFPEFLVILDSLHALERNTRFQSLRDSANNLFDRTKHHGTNPDVFYYQVIDNINYLDVRIMMRISFYQGTHALAIFEMDISEE